MAKTLSSRRILLIIDFNYEDMEVNNLFVHRTSVVGLLTLDLSIRLVQVQYPKIRLEEEGATVTVAGGHPAGTKYTGKFGDGHAPSSHLNGGGTLTVVAAILTP